MNCLGDKALKSCTAMASQRASVGIVALLALALGACSGSNASQETVTATASSSAQDTHESRYMQLCTKDFVAGRDRHAQRIGCECAFQAAHKRLNDIEMEMLLAKRAQDKQKQTEIRARQDYSDAAFMTNMKGSTEEAIACAASKSSQ